MKMFDIFLVFALNIGCGSTLEPPQTDTIPLETEWFYKHKCSVNLTICCKVLEQLSPFKHMGITKFDIAVTQVKVKVKAIICINFEKPKSLMLHTEFQDHWTSGSKEKTF